jgi:hypothetical protein
LEVKGSLKEIYGGIASQFVLAGEFLKVWLDEFEIRQSAIEASETAVVSFILILWTSSGKQEL